MSAMIGSSARFMRVALFSYADRALAFLLPLLVIKLLNRPAAYAEIEYIISLSIILAGFADLGLRSYLLFAFRLSRNVDQVIEQAYGALRLVLGIQLAAVAVSLAVAFSSVGGSVLVVLLTFCRVGALTLFGIVGQILILRDRAVLSTSLSLACWLLSAVALVAPKNISDHLFVSLFLLPNGIATLLVLTWTATRTRAQTLRQSSAFLGSALRWSWPLLIATALNLVVGNFAKIYAFATMPQTDMLQIAFYQRLAMLLQISHAAIMVVLSKHIFAVADERIDRGSTIQYAIYMGLTGALLIGGLWASRLLDWLPVPWNPAIAALTALYILFWCLGAYFEVYVNRAGHNHKLLMASIVSASIYGGILLTAANITPNLLVSAMAVSALAYAAASYGLALKGAGR